MKKYKKYDWICFLKTKSVPYRTFSLATSTVGHKMIKPWTFFMIRMIEPSQRKNVYLKKKQIGNMKLSSFFILNQDFFKETMAWALKLQNSPHPANLMTKDVTRCHWASKTYEKTFSMFSFHLLNFFFCFLMIFHGILFKGSSLVVHLLLASELPPPPP